MVLQKWRLTKTVQRRIEKQPISFSISFAHWLSILPFYLIISCLCVCVNIVCMRQATIDREIEANHSACWEKLRIAWIQSNWASYSNAQSHLRWSSPIAHHTAYLLISLRSWCIRTNSLAFAHRPQRTRACSFIPLYNYNRLYL